MGTSVGCREGLVLGVDVVGLEDGVLDEGGTVGKALGAVVVGV